MVKPKGSPKDALLKRKNQYVAFLDILGFQELLYRADYAQTIEKLVAALKRRMDFDGKHYPGLRYLAISDSIIITAERGGGRALVRKIAQVQTALLREGFCVRGAVNFGRILTHEGVAGRNLFGRAYVKAYQSERDLAIYPRVVVLQNCHARLTDEVRNGSTQPLATYIRSDVDGVHFVNQFSSQIIGLRAKSSRNRTTARRDRERFRAQIKRALKETAANPKANMKWRWLSSQLDSNLLK